MRWLAAVLALLLPTTPTRSHSPRLLDFGYYNAESSLDEVAPHSTTAMVGTGLNFSCYWSDSEACITEAAERDVATLRRLKARNMTGVLGEAKGVTDLLAQHGLKRGEDELNPPATCTSLLGTCQRCIS